ncbi:MAG: MMPL family transporter [Hyphomicrobiaceae bacterium]|nr:MMPL family transporter [Hyphomicrobiaceae bacterium]
MTKRTGAADEDRSARHEGFWFSFGIERLGLVPLRAPVLSAIVMVLVSIAAIPGMLAMSVDDSLSELFRTNTEEFRRYEEISKRFPSSEFDVLVVIEDDKLLTPGNLEAVRNVILDLQLIPGLNGLISMFSVREVPDESGFPKALFPAELPEGAEFDALLERIRSNEIIQGKLLSEDGTLALIVLSLDKDRVLNIGLGDTIAEIEQVVAEALEGTALHAQLAGAPVMQLEIRNAVQRDRLIYNGLGFLLGAVIAYIFFGSFSHMLIAVAGPVAGVLWSLGAIGYLGFKLNLFVNVITPLIIVNGFSDSMHLVFNVRREIMAGASRLEAARRAVIAVAPACFLTALTAGIALAAFIFAKSALIRTFGGASTLAVIVSYVAVVMVVPTLAALLLPREKRGRTEKEPSDAPMQMLARASETVFGHLGRFPVPYVVAGIALVILTGLAYTDLRPHYRLADQVPDQEQALEAASRLDEKLTGANPVHVMVEWKDGRSIYDQSVLEVIADAHNVVEKQAGVGNVWSVETLRRWLKKAGDPSVETLKEYIGLLPEHLVRRFIAVDGQAIVVSGRLPDVDASEILPVVDDLDQALEPIRKAYPDFTLSVTGLSAIAARNSAQMIWELNVGLVSDIFVVVVFLGLAFRSLFASIVSILPSLLPIFGTGALLWLTGDGLHFASIIALTVAFGLALDSTIHFINRYFIEERDADGRVRPTSEALARTARVIGPVLILTTIVLALGLGVTIFSDLPSLRVFGQLSGATLFAALLAQLVVLPASIALLRRYWPVDRTTSTTPRR